MIYRRQVPITFIMLRYLDVNHFVNRIVNSMCYLISTARSTSRKIIINLTQPPRPPYFFMLGEGSRYAGLAIPPLFMLEKSKAKGVCDA